VPLIRAEHAARSISIEARGALVDATRSAHRSSLCVARIVISMRVVRAATPSSSRARRACAARTEQALLGAHAASHAKATRRSSRADRRSAMSHHGRVDLCGALPTVHAGDAEALRMAPDD